VGGGQGGVLGGGGGGGGGVMWCLQRGFVENLWGVGCKGGGGLGWVGPRLWVWWGVGCVWGGCGNFLDKFRREEATGLRSRDVDSRSGRFEATR